jgi:signal transduction histidine kinase
MPWVWLLIGVLAGGPLWIALTYWLARRVWRNARRLSARARGHEHLAEVGQLVGGLAHEIKNPLSTINVNLKLLSEDLSRHGDELHQRWLRRLSAVQHEAGRVRDTLDDFLRFAGKVELSPAPTDVRQIVQELADFFAPQADAAKAILRVSLPETPVRCNIDANLIKQAILNLMINAVQAMPQGGELLVRVTSSRASAVIEVIDTGPGIEPQKLAMIFKVYYSTKRGGTGLGLPITRRIVEEHGGSITAESEIGKGTRFTIQLPLVRE